MFLAILIILIIVKNKNVAINTHEISKLIILN